MRFVSNSPLDPVSTAAARRGPGLSCGRMDDLEERLDALFAGPPGDFTATRTALAKELRAGGDREAADRVAGLRKPTKLAAELNRLAREEPEALAAAIEAEVALAETQRRMLAGEASADEMGAASEAEAAAVGALSDDVAVRAAIRAAARRDDEREELRRGRLSKEPEPDLGAALFGGQPPPPAPAAPRRRAGAPAAPPADELAARRAKRAAESTADRGPSPAEARALARTAAAHARSADKRLAEARRARERAERAREKAEAEAARQRERLDEAEEAAAASAREADRAAEAEAGAAAEAERAARLVGDADRLLAELTSSD